MSAAVSNIVEPAAAKAPATFARLINTYCYAIVGHFMRRGAVATHRELDDRALRDIGPVRTQIEAAVHGLLITSAEERMS
jgi:uncharacterized protein YjiS (DUF1127 family)